MKLCIPIYYKDKIYTDIEIKKPIAGVIADTQEAFEESTSYHGISTLIVGCTVSLTDNKGVVVNNKSEVSILIRQMAYQAAEQVALAIMLTINKDDKVHSIHTCPRCHNVLNNQQPVSIKDLPTVYLETGKNIIDIKLDEPIQLCETNGNILYSIDNFSLRYPTLNDCIDGSMGTKSNSDVKKQYAIYGRSIVTINKDEVTLVWSQQWSEWVINNLPYDKLSEIASAMKKYGLDNTVEKICSNPKCKKVWKSVISTADFFVSGLQQ
jgi:hypothetical protein